MFETHIILSILYYYYFFLFIFKLTVFTTDDYCEIVVNDIKEFKAVGSIWISPHDPCSLHSCEVNKRGIAVEVVKKDNCGDFYCDIVSKLS